MGGPLSSRLAAPLPLSSAEAALFKNKLLVIEQKTVRLGHHLSPDAADGVKPRCYALLSPSCVLRMLWSVLSIF